MITEIVKFLLNIFDSFNQKKIFKVIKKYFPNNINCIFDVGAHDGQMIKFYTKNFNVEKIYAFEPNKKIFDKLKKKTKNIYGTELFLFDFAIGNISEKKILHETLDSLSSTIKEINEESKYYKRKKFILSGFAKKNFFQEKMIWIKNFKEILQENKIENIDLLKIDTEGYEFDVLNGIADYISKVKMITFEHHYDDMIKKNYKFHDVDYLLTKNNFKRIFKLKMFFRKSFEYIYWNNNYQY